MEKGRKIQLEQRTKAESDYAVAAASILAREKFIDWLEEKGSESGMALPRGVSAQVKNAAVALIQSKGPEALEIHAKMHFKTAAEALAAAAGSPTPA
jgi:ribonuclease HIII